MNLISRARVLNFILVIFILYATLSFAICVLNSVDTTGGTDLFTYWRINHFTRQGEDPYFSFLADAKIQLPVSYFDGHVAKDYPIANVEVKQKLPANSPAMLFLLLPLSYLSWFSAKIIWLLISIMLVLAMPWIVCRLIPANMDFISKLILALTFYGMPGTRAAIVTGQTSVLTIVMVFMTFLFAQKNQNWIAGITLAIALCKFSVALPIVIYLIFKKKWLVLSVGLIIQCAAVFGFGWLRQDSVVAVLLDFIQIAGAHASFNGIHLTGLVTPSMSTTLMVAVVFSCMVFLPLWYMSANSNFKQCHVQLKEIMVFGILCLWALLVAYHRAYDIGLVLVSLFLFLYLTKQLSYMGFSVIVSRLMVLLFWAVVGALSIPVRFIEDILGLWWKPLMTGVTTLDIVLLLGLSFMFLSRLDRLGFYSVESR